MKTVIGENFLRVALIAFNFVFSILSISLIALGVIYSDQLWNVKTYIGYDFLKFPTILLVLGSLSFVMSVAGCYGARSYNRKFFMGFLMILGCLLVVEIIVSVIAFKNIDAKMINKTKSVMINQLFNQDMKGREIFHGVEESLECCGVDGPDDYLQDDWHNPEQKYCCGVEDCIEELKDDCSELWDKPGCAMIVATESQQIAEEAAAAITVYSILQILEMGCVLMMLRLSVN